MHVAKLLGHGTCAQQSWRAARDRVLRECAASEWAQPHSQFNISSLVLSPAVTPAA